MPSHSVRHSATTIASTSLRSGRRTMKTYTPSTEVDFVVIGAGAAGGVMAKELSSAGFQVVVLEQGPYLQGKDFQHQDEMADFLPRPRLLVNDHKLQPNTFRQSAQEKAVLASSVTYGRCVGGGTVHYTGTMSRFHESDFRERSIVGPISGTG